MAQNPNIDDATRARASKFVADKAESAPAKKRIVSKKELEASGLSLRDFLNKERGLTRRKEVNPTASEDKDKAAQETAERIDPGAPALSRGLGDTEDGGRAFVARQKAALDRANASQIPSGGPKRTLEEYYDTGMADTDKKAGRFKRGGKVTKMASGGETFAASKRGDGIASKGKTRCKMY